MAAGPLVISSNDFRKIKIHVPNLTSERKKTYVMSKRKKSKDLYHTN